MVNNPGDPPSSGWKKAYIIPIFSPWSIEWSLGSVMHFALHLSFTVATGFFHDEPRRLRGLIPGKRARWCSLLDTHKCFIKSQVKSQSITNYALVCLSLSQVFDVLLMFFSIVLSGIHHFWGGGSTTTPYSLLSSARKSEFVAASATAAAPRRCGGT